MDMYINHALTHTTHGLTAKAQPYCKCKPIEGKIECKCGEDYFTEWGWDNTDLTPSTIVIDKNLEVNFHRILSQGTAAVRGNSPFLPGYEYYWEVKILTHLFGTDFMIGVGTNNMNLKEAQYYFCSLLGKDKNSWGYSYNGIFYHNGEEQRFGNGFVQGSLVGIHIDLWKGTLEYYINRSPLGVKIKCSCDELFPMISSTTARSAVRLTCSSSCKLSLKLLSYRTLSRNFNSLQYVNEIPGLQQNCKNFFWLSFRKQVQEVESKLNDTLFEICESDSENETKQTIVKQKGKKLSKLKHFEIKNKGGYNLRSCESNGSHKHSLIENKIHIPKSKFKRNKK